MPNECAYEKLPFFGEKPLINFTTLSPGFPCEGKENYRVIQEVSDLGWVDLDLGCSTTLPGQ